MNDRVYLDASFIVSSQIQQNPHFQKADRIAKELIDKSLYISYLVIDEVMHGLGKYGMDKRVIYKFIVLELIEANNVTLLVNKPMKQDLKTFMRFWGKTSLQPRDAMHIFLMKEHGISTIASFDRDFIERQQELKIEVLG